MFYILQMIRFILWTKYNKNGTIKKESLFIVFQAGEEKKAPSPDKNNDFLLLRIQT